MAAEIIQDWTNARVVLADARRREVRYRVYRHAGRLYQEIRELDGAPIHTLQLPPDVPLYRKSYEALLRYVLQDLVGN